MSASALPRVLGTTSIAVLASAAMGPAYSLASTLGPVVGQAGTQAPVALAALSALMLCVAVGFARLASTYPHAGSSYGWAELAFGRAAGAYGAWLLLLSNFFATMATALPAGTYTLALLRPSLADAPLAAAVVGALWIVASAALLAAGMRPTAGVSALFLLAELVVVIGSGAATLWLLPHAPPATPGPDAVPLHGLAGLAGVSGFAGAMVLGIWMSDGWEVSASASEETTGPRAAGRGGIVGLLLTTAVLLFATVAYLRLGVGPLARHETNELDFVAGTLGGGWRFAIAATVLVSTAATLWTTMLYLSRSVFAMGRAGVLPRALGALDRRGSPATANLVVAGATGIATLAVGLAPKIQAALTLVFNGTSVFLGLLFVLSVAAGMRLAAPRDRLLAAVVPGVGGAGLLAVVAVTLWQTDATTREIVLGGMALGVPFAVWQRKTPRDATAES